MSKLILNTDVELIYTARDNAGELKDLSLFDLVEILIVDKGRTKIIAGPYTAVSSHEGADFENGKAVVSIPRNDTKFIVVKDVLIDMQLTLGDKKTGIVASDIATTVKWLFP